MGRKDGISRSDGNDQPGRAYSGSHPTPAELTALAGLDPECPAGSLPPEVPRHVDRCSECREALALLGSLEAERDRFGTHPGNGDPAATQELAGRLRRVFFGEDKAPTGTDAGIQRLGGRQRQRSLFVRRALTASLTAAAILLLFLVGPDIIDRSPATPGLFGVEWKTESPVVRSPNGTGSQNPVYLEPNGKFWITGRAERDATLHAFAWETEKGFQALPVDDTRARALVVRAGEGFRLPDRFYRVGAEPGVEVLLVVALRNPLADTDMAKVADNLTKTWRAVSVDDRDPLDPVWCESTAKELARSLEAVGYGTSTVAIVGIEVHGHGER